MLLAIFVAVVIVTHVLAANRSQQEKLPAGAAGTPPMSEWAPQYVEFHAANRDVGPWLIYTCRVENGIHCNGFGDRLRLLGFMLRAAAALRRVLLIDWQSPQPFELFFEPATFDWRVPSSALAAEAAMPGKNRRIRHGIYNEAIVQWRSELNEKEWAVVRGMPVVRIVGNTQWQSSIDIPDVRVLRDAARPPDPPVTRRLPRVAGAQLTGALVERALAGDAPADRRAAVANA